MKQESPVQDEERVITDEMLALARSRIGAPMKVHVPFNEFVTVDAMRHFAHGTGDDNPMYCDRNYGAKTRWGNMIAPPLFYRSTGNPEPRDWSKEDSFRARDPLSGIHSWYVGETIHWLRPIYPGDQLFARRFRQDFLEKRSSFTGGRAVIEVVRQEFRNQRGELVVVADEKEFRGGRQKKWGERTKYAHYERQSYTPEDLERLDRAYDAEARRGGSPRYWEDIVPGDELPPLVKGPITVTDMVNWKMGGGLAMLFHGAHRLAYQWRKAHPRAYVTNADGIPDIAESVHWDEHIARLTGNPYPYDFGEQRVAWLTHLITEWMGDDAWLLSLESQVRRFVYIGDTVWIKGEVADKEVSDGEYRVTINVKAEDHRNEVTAIGTATVLLPSRAKGPVTLPPKLDLASAG